MNALEFPFGLSLSFDKLRMIGIQPFDKLRANGSSSMPA
jgi:hypothetical protein